MVVEKLCQVSIHKLVSLLLFIFYIPAQFPSLYRLICLTCNYAAIRIISQCKGPKDGLLINCYVFWGTPQKCGC